MKQGSNQRGRSRGRNNKPRNNNNILPRVSVNTTFDSNGPGGRIRGSAHQILDKYLSLARDAYSQNDRVLAENFFQYADHYGRVINSFQEKSPRPVFSEQPNQESSSLDSENKEPLQEQGQENFETESSFTDLPSEESFEVIASTGSSGVTIISEEENRTKPERKKRDNFRGRRRSPRENSSQYDMSSELALSSSENEVTSVSAE